MSLDDIIKEKKIGGFRAKGMKPTVKPKKQLSGGATGKFSPKKTVKKPILDARNKIIQKNRAKIHDARDRLAQIAKRSGDARLKLMKKKKVVGLTSAGKRNAGGPAGLKRLPPIPARQPARPVEVFDYTPPSADLRRTVKNEFAYGSGTSMPPLPTFKYMEPPKRSENVWDSDPFDCYEVPVARPYDVSEPRNLNRSIRTSAHMDAVPTKGILRTSSSNDGVPTSTFGRSLSLSAPSADPYSMRGSAMSDPRRRYASIEENSHLSSEMRNRLQRTPNVTQSSGIFSNPYASSAREVKQSSSSQGYRIVVSNLHSSVSQSDIKVSHLFASSQ